MKRCTSLAACAVALAALTACGAAESSRGGDLSDGALKECVTAANELKTSMRDEAPFQAPKPFDMQPNRGKSLWVVNAARVPFLQSISDGAESAGNAAGMSVNVVYGDGTTNSAQAAVRQAIAQGADGIALVVIDPTTIQSAVDDAKGAGIVVTDVINRSVGDSPPPGVAGQMVLDLPSEMDAMAGWIMADSNCSASTLMYAPSALPITATAAALLQRRYEALCPSCPFELKDLDYGNYAQTLTAEVQTDLRRKPDLNYIFAIIGSSVPNVDAGVRGRDVRILAHDGLPENLEALRTGATNEVADFAFPPNESIGWQIVDQQARLLLGQSEAFEVVVPSRLVDRDNVGTSDSDVWPGYADYEDAYTQGWQG